MKDESYYFSNVIQINQLLRKRERVIQIENYAIFPCKVRVGYEAVKRCFMWNVSPHCKLGLLGVPHAVSLSVTVASYFGPPPGKGAWKLYTIKIFSAHVLLKMPWLFMKSVFK